MPLRKDLKPGTVFRYNNAPFDSPPWRVPGADIPAAFINATESCNPAWDNEVTVVWKLPQPPDETKADHKIATAGKKPPLSVMPLESLIGPNRVGQYGRKKYAPGNFHLATIADGAPQRYIDGLLRHVQAMQKPNGIVDGESVASLDEESGLPHIDHAICGLLMLRSILVKEKVLPADPGEGKEPPK